MSYLRPVYSDTTQLNSTSSGVELSCVAINGPLVILERDIATGGVSVCPSHAGNLYFILYCLQSGVYKQNGMKWKSKLRWILNNKTSEDYKKKTSRNSSATHVTLHPIRPIRLFVPCITLTLKTENHITFNLREVTHVRSDWQSNFEGWLHIVSA